MTTTPLNKRKPLKRAAKLPKGIVVPPANPKCEHCGYMNAAARRGGKLYCTRCDPEGAVILKRRIRSLQRRVDLAHRHLLSMPVPMRKAHREWWAKMYAYLKR